MSEPTEAEFKNWKHRGFRRNEVSDRDAPIEVAWAFLCYKAKVPSSTRCCAVRAAGGKNSCEKNEYECWGIYTEILIEVRDGVRKWVGNGMKFYVPPKEKKKKKNRFDNVLLGLK